MIIRLDSSTAVSSDKSGQAAVIDKTGMSGSSITPFDTVLKSAEQKNTSTSAWNSANDKVVQASEISPDERACRVNVPSKYVNIFENASSKYGVAYDLLVSVASAESNFNPSCSSSSGAMGVMQLMPATAKYLGVDNAYDAESNIMGGAKYLAEKLKEHGSVKLAVAAYNAGSGAVEKYGGVPPYSETQNYVNKVLSNMGSDGNESGFIGALSSSTAAGNTAVAPEDAMVTVAGVNMTYSAYLRYLELMNLGVG